MAEITPWSEEQKAEYLKQVEEHEREMLLNGGERCARCGVMWADPYEAMCCPCHDLFPEDDFV